MYVVEKKKSEKGFTLIELLIYIALTGGIMAGVIAVSYPILTGAGNLSERVTMEIESSFVLRKIAWALSSAGASAISAPSLGTVNAPALTVNGMTFIDSSGAITLNGTPLTAERIVFDNFSVTYVNDTTDYLEIRFTADGIAVGPYRHNVRY